MYRVYRCKPFLQRRVLLIHQTVFAIRLNSICPLQKLENRGNPIVETANQFTPIERKRKLLLFVSIVWPLNSSIRIGMASDQIHEFFHGIGLMAGLDNVGYRNTQDRMVCSEETL